MDKSFAWSYCFMAGDKAVFLDRKDREIKTFDTYKEAEDYAKENIHLIDRKVIHSLKKPKT